VAEGSNINQALTLAQTADLEIAVLRCGGHRIKPVAEVIDGCRLPFVISD
jgi:hypothetical protein